MAHASAIESLLHPLFGDPHQKTVMPVRIVGMPLKMGTNRFNPGIGILGQLNPVAFYPRKAPDVGFSFELCGRLNYRAFEQDV